MIIRVLLVAALCKSGKAERKKEESRHTSALIHHTSYIAFGLSLQLSAWWVAATALLAGVGVGLLRLAFVVDHGQVLAAHLLGLLVDGALGYAAFTKRSD